MSGIVIQSTRFSGHDDACRRGAVVIEKFDQWDNPPEAHAAMCWCSTLGTELAAA